MRYGSLTYNACSCISHRLVQRLNIKSATLLDTGADEAGVRLGRERQHDERRVITNIEIPKAKDLNEPIRTSHRYKNILPNDDVTYRKVNGVEYSNHQE